MWISPVRRSTTNDPRVCSTIQPSSSWVRRLINVSVFEERLRDVSGEFARRHRSQFLSDRRVGFDQTVMRPLTQSVEDHLTSPSRPCRNGLIPKLCCGHEELGWTNSPCRVEDDGPIALPVGHHLAPRRLDPKRPFVTVPTEPHTTTLPAVGRLMPRW